MIHPVQKIIINNKVWYYQEFTPDSICDDSGVNLYDSNGDYVEEFPSYEEMKSWIMSHSAK